MPGCQNGRFWGLPRRGGKGTSGTGGPRARLRKIFWYQDTCYPVHRCVCVFISPPHPTHPHPTPPQVEWWCDVRMCDLWWYGGEVAVRINNTLDRLEGSADFGTRIQVTRYIGVSVRLSITCTCVACGVPECPTHPTPSHPGCVVVWWHDLRCVVVWWCYGYPTRSTA